MLSERERLNVGAGFRRSLTRRPSDFPTHRGRARKWNGKESGRIERFHRPSCLFWLESELGSWRPLLG